MKHSKSILFGLAVLFAAAAFGTYKLGFEIYRPGVSTTQGDYARHDVAFMARCGKARFTSLFLDPDGSRIWRTCEYDLGRYSTTGQFVLRHNTLLVLSGLSVLCAVGFVRLIFTARPSPKVVRGRKLLSVRSARSALRTLSRRECRSKNCD